MPSDVAEHALPDPTAAFDLNVSPEACIACVATIAPPMLIPSPTARLFVNESLFNTIGTVATSAPPSPVEHHAEPPPARLPENTLPVTDGIPEASASAPPSPVLPFDTPPATLLVKMLEVIVTPAPSSKIAAPSPCAKLVQPVLVQPDVGQPLVAVHPVLALNVSFVNEAWPRPTL